METKEQCCAACYNHITKEQLENTEHCPHCGNDLMGGKSYNQTIDKDIAENIQLILKTNSCVHPYDKLKLNNNGRIVCKICNKKLS